MISQNQRYCEDFRWVIIALLLCVTHMAAAADTQSLTSPDGTVTISWNDSYSDFTTLVVSGTSGEYRATYPVTDGQNWVLSGLENGDYTFELHADSGSGSALTVATLTVEHYSLRTAGALFFIGFIIFACLLFTLRKITHGTSHD